MRSFLFLFAFIFCFLNSECQDIKVKKGSLLMDKVHVATFEGKIGLLKTNLTLKALDNSILFTLKAKYFGTNLPQCKSFEFYVLDFPKTENRVLFYKDISYYNEKQISKLLFNDMGLKISGNEIAAASINKFIEENDKTAEIAEDTVKTRDLEKLIVERLKEDQIIRDKDAKLVFKSLTSEEKNLTISEIWQADVKLGTFTIKMTMKPMPPGASSAGVTKADLTVYTYTIERAISTPFEFDGIEYDKVPVSIITVDGGKLSRCVTIQEGGLHGITQLKGIEGKDGDVEKVCKYLIEKEYL